MAAVLCQLKEDWKIQRGENRKLDINLEVHSFIDHFGTFGPGSYFEMAHFPVKELFACSQGSVWQKWMLHFWLLTQRKEQDMHASYLVCPGFQVGMGDLGHHTWMHQYMKNAYMILSRLLCERVLRLTYNSYKHASYTCLGEAFQQQQKLFLG